MALSGTFYKNVGSHWRLQAEWSATQNIVNNTSTVTMKLYWMGLDKYASTDTTATKSGQVTVAGSSSGFSGSGLAKLDGAQKKLLKTYTVTVDHYSDGTKNVTLSGYFDVNLALGGTYYGRVSLEKTVTLNTIPRASKLNDSTPNWTAGSDITFGITRYSSSFTHEIEIYLENPSGNSTMPDGTKCTHLKQLKLSSSETSKSSSFTFSEKETTFLRLNTKASIKAWIRLQTFSGGSQIGSSQEYYGTVTAPAATTLSVPSNINIGEALKGTLSKKNSSFSHDIRLYLDTPVNGVSYYDLMLRTDGTASSFTFDTNQIANLLYAQCPNSNSWKGRVRIWTHFGDPQVREGLDYYVTFNVVNSNPTFSETGISCADTNATTTALTGDPSVVIQNASQVSVTIPAAAKAVAQNAASMVSYIAILNGIQRTANYSTGDITFSFGTINAGTNQTLTVKAVDSRGNSTSVTKTVTVLPYTPPTLNSSAKRKNGFDSITTLLASGSISALTVGGVQKNEVTAVKYRYKKVTDADTVSTWAVWRAFEVTKAGNTYVTTAVQEDLDNTQSFNVEFLVTDKLGSRTNAMVVSQGKPIMFVDSLKKSVGVGKFPVNNNSLEVEGTAEATEVKVTERVVLAKDRYHLNSGGAGIQLNNSDISGANNIVFNDPSNSDSEAIHFPKSGTAVGDTNYANYDSFRMLDGVMYMNSEPVFIHNIDTKMLWQGAMYMTSAQTVTPTRKITDCPNGWVFAWSDFDAPSTANNFDWNYTFVHKSHVAANSGTGVHHVVAAGTGTGQLISKYLYVYTDKITGNDANGSGSYGTDVVLRRIIAW